MPRQLTVATALLGSIENAVKENFDKSKLYYVNTLRERKEQTGEVTWLEAEEAFGLSPVVSPEQNSPLIGQGGYRQFKSGALETRHTKRFTRDELEKLLSPDERFQIMPIPHIKREVEDMMRRVYETIEYVGHCAMARGAVRYVNNQSNNRLNINITFPIRTKTVSVTWSNASADIIGDVDAWLEEYALVGNGKPDVMRMTSYVWKQIKNNTAIKNYIFNVLRMNPKDFQTTRGVLTTELVSTALDWPTIQIYDTRYKVKGTASANVTAGSSVTVALSEGTFGFNVGDKVLIRYADESWDEEATITTVNHGVSIVLDSISNNISAGDVIVAKPTFFPADRILFDADEKTDLEITKHPFGIQPRGGNVQLPDWYGPKADAFMPGDEPNITVFKRVWDKFGYRRRHINKVMSCKVLL